MPVQEGNTTSRDTFTPPPFACSTTRNSLAWLLDGAPVNFTRQVAEATTSGSSVETSSKSDSEAEYITDHQTKHMVEDWVAQHHGRHASAHSLDGRAQSTPKESPTRSTILAGDTPHAERTADIRDDFPILANDIIMHSNPNKPRVSKWPAVVRRHWWWRV